MHMFSGFSGYMEQALTISQSDSLRILATYWKSCVTYLQEFWKQEVRHCGLVGSVCTWERNRLWVWSLVVSDILYIPCSLSLRLLGSLRGFLGINALTQNCVKKKRISLNKWKEENIGMWNRPSSLVSPVKNFIQSASSQYVAYMSGVKSGAVKLDSIASIDVSVSGNFERVRRAIFITWKEIVEIRINCIIIIIVISLTSIFSKINPGYGRLLPNSTR